MGVKLVITKAAQELSGLKPPHNYESLKALKDKFGRFGLSLCGLEGDQFDMNAIKLGLPARELHLRPENLPMLDPRHYGFDIDYLPLKDRV